MDQELFLLPAATANQTTPQILFFILRKSLLKYLANNQQKIKKPLMHTSQQKLTEHENFARPIWGVRLPIICRDYSSKPVYHIPVVRHI